ncbi:DUF1102 domain-containing protein [Halorubrum distributum]|uniref:DUF1102 domain-containing protein n=1 Tax=Halorubrum distributum TaxID=29283 RepID=UPI00295443AD|nr:DUF1102 domain-containing protein [Halorubrum distributum]MDV7350872.1 DUF1102 domain-containing protein [Halorubrum distributum]
MERRKFVVGLGALASGSAAAVGTGAFTSVTANRSVDVEVAGDASAYLGIEPVSSSPNSDYVQVNSGEVSIDFSDSNPNTSGTNATLGDGFNPDATTVVNDLLRVTNQGTQPVDFTISLNLSTGSASVTLSTDELGGESDLVANSIEILPGESIKIDLNADTTGQGKASISGSITFSADAN